MSDHPPVQSSYAKAVVDSGQGEGGVCENWVVAQSDVKKAITRNPSFVSITNRDKGGESRSILLHEAQFHAPPTQRQRERWSALAWNRD